MLSHNLIHLFEETSLIVAFMKGPDHRFEYVNPAHIQLLGFDATGKTVREVQPEAGDAGVIQLLNNVYNTGKSVRLPEATIPIGDRIHYFDFIYSCSRDESGNIDGVMALVNDITEEVLNRRQVIEGEKELLNIRYQLEKAVSISHTGFYDWDIKNDRVLFSAQMQKDWGFEANTSLTEVVKLIHPEDYDRVALSIQAAIQHRVPYHTEYRVVRPKDRRTIWVDAQGEVTYDEQGVPTRFFGTSIDITEKVTARKNLERSEANILQVANAMPQIVWTARPDGILNYTNERWTQYSDGAGPENWLSFVHPDDLSRVTETWAHSIHTSERYETEFRLREGKSQKYRWFLVRAQPSYDSNGNIDRWIGTCTDIEEQKQALTIRSEFISIASHELKTPLTSLKLHGQMMRRYFDRGEMPKISQLITKNENQINRLARLVDDMLDFSKIEAGKLSVALEKVDLGPFVQEVYERLEEQLAAAGCVSTFESLNEMRVAIDPFRMEQVITNLLTNAARYGRGKPVLVRVLKSGSMAEVQVQDLGMGIEASDLDRIFNRFERAVSANEVSGLGLGLYISRQIVESHQGKIWVESAVGKGSIFKIQLPLVSFV